MLYVATSKHSWYRWNVGLLLCGYAGLGLLHGHVGRPGERRLLAALPPVAACRLGDGRRLTAVEAIQVGLVFRASHLLTNLSSGGSMATWTDPNPWASSPQSSSAREPSSTGAPTAKVQVADQDDESEFSVMLEAAAYYNRYVAKVGGLPADAEDLTVEQISAVVRKVKTLGQPPLRL